MYLSKSDFKTARDCPSKLYYKKLGYPSTLRDDPYLQYLAEAGFVVEKIAQLLYSEGREFAFALHEVREASAATRDWIARSESGTLFEAVVSFKQFAARIDILHKQGARLELIEVKSASVSYAKGDPIHNNDGSVSAARRDYVEDVLFQAELLRRAFPDHQVVPILCMVNKDRIASENWRLDRFTLHPPTPGSAFKRPEVSYTGDAGALAVDHPLDFIDLSADWRKLGGELWQAAERFAGSLSGEVPVRLPGELLPRCKSCEYRYHRPDDYDTPELSDGFLECWGERARVRPHIVDLSFAGDLGGRSSGSFARLVAEEFTDLREIDEGLCIGKRGVRQRIQIIYSRRNEEYIDPELPAHLASHAYPLHFIDFEATRTAVPYHAGLHPYELVCFQWSCHTRRAPGAELEHREWLNTEPGFPNTEFARTLQEAIGEEGTVYIWSSFENSALREIRRRIACAGSDNENAAGSGEVAAWLDRIVDSERLVDLEKLCITYYFHPAMAGSTSIKYVLPAVLAADPAILARPEFAAYRSAAGNPYDTLPPFELPGGTVLDAVREGTAAIRAYEAMVFGPGAEEPQVRSALADLLRQYCALDTAAMVMIQHRWRG